MIAASSASTRTGVRAVSNVRITPPVLSQLQSYLRTQLGGSQAACHGLHSLRCGMRAEAKEKQPKPLIARYVLRFFLDKLPFNVGPSISALQALAPALFGNVPCVAVHEISVTQVGNPRGFRSEISAFDPKVLAGSIYAALFDTAAAISVFYAGRILPVPLSFNRSWESCDDLMGSIVFILFRFCIQSFVVSLMTRVLWG